MATSDGISTADWDRIHELAVDLCNAADGPDEGRTLAELMQALDRLEAKYGPLPSITATRADFARDERDREELWLQVYEQAVKRGDAPNLIEIAHSLAEFYVERRDRANSLYWLNVFREHLGSSDHERHKAEWERLSKLCADAE